MPDLKVIPESIDGYRSEAFRMSPEAARILGSDTTLTRLYSDGRRELEFFLGFFKDQQKNSQIHSPKHCYPGSGWDIIREDEVRLKLEEDILPARSILISDGNSKRLVIYWFNINGRFTNNEFGLKWQQLKSSLMGRPGAAAFLRFSVILQPGREEEAREQLVRLAGKLQPFIEQSMEGIYRGD
jgi:EpsI family protein